MGAGAGYIIKTKGFDLTGNIIKVLSCERRKDPYVMDLSVDYSGIVKEMRADSYMYGTENMEDVPVVCTEMTVSVAEFSIAEISKEKSPDEIDLAKLNDLILDGLRNSYSEYCYGGGWTHSTFDGTLTERNSISTENTPAIEIVSTDIKLANVIDIEYVDKAVSGDMDYTTYDVYAGDDPLDGFDNIDDAREYAARCENATEICETWWHEHRNGDTDFVGHGNIEDVEHEEDKSA